MRISLMIAAGLLVTACDGRNTTTGGSAPTQAGAAGNEMAANDASAEAAPMAAEFAQRVAMSDMFEIASGNLAVKMAASDKTREFGRMMVADHTKSTSQLMAAAKQAGKTFEMPTQLDGEHQAKLESLQNLDKAAFDREYTTQQMAGHRETLALLKAYGADGDTAELRQFAQQAIPVVQKHHDQLETDAASLPAAAATSAPVLSGGSAE